MSQLSYQCKLQTKVGEGTTREVGDVTRGVHKVRLVLICVEPEIAVGFGGECSQTDLHCVWSNVKFICKVLNKFELMLEIGSTLTGRGIQQKHDVRLVAVASCNEILKTLSM